MRADATITVAICQARWFSVYLSTAAEVSTPSVIYVIITITRNAWQSSVYSPLGVVVSLSRANYMNNDRFRYLLSMNLNKWLCYDRGTARRYANAVHAVVVYLSVRFCVCVCHTLVLCKNG